MLLPNWSDESALSKKSIRAGWGEGIVQLARKNSQAVVLNADLPGSLKLEGFIHEFPDRYFQVGVAEQNMAGIATGMAHAGKIPFITSFAAFSPGLNFSQIRLAAMSHLPLKIVGSHYGLNVGPDGASAQMESDIAMMRALPDVRVFSPADYNQAIQLVAAMAEGVGTDYIRVTRADFPVFLDISLPLEIGKAQKLLDGSDITLIATGSMVYEALQVAQSFIATGKTVDFLNIHTIKPLDSESIITSAQKTGKVVVIEEHNVEGGLGDAVASVLSEHCPTRLLKIGIADTFAESGTHRELWMKYGLDRKVMFPKIETWINQIG
ncbi:transketolase family protein [Candidatus Gracilibacteria bacterium]|nr:transketolase family protein [Candidatus Gracilibacteria bacterium]